MSLLILAGGFTLNTNLEVVAGANVSLRYTAGLSKITEFSG